MSNGATYGMPIVRSPRPGEGPANHIDDTDYTVVIESGEDTATGKAVVEFYTAEQEERILRELVNRRFGFLTASVEPVPDGEPVESPDGEPAPAEEALAKDVEQFRAGV
jgi:hypothetical protein